jgi:hypothetical protein
MFLENMISAFEPKTVGSVKSHGVCVSSGNARWKTETAPRRVTRGSLWTERKTGWASRSGRSRNDDIAIFAYGIENGTPG